MPADFVSFEECQAEAKQQLEERHPDLVRFLGKEYANFVLIFAANVAHTTAAEASRRAKSV